MDSKARTTHRTELLPVALVLLAALLAHGWSVSCGWIWDDDSYVTANPLLSSPNGWFEVFIPGSTPQYYPLVFLGFWIQHAVSGIEPFAYHAVNVLMHAANAALLFLVMRRLRIAGDLWIAIIFAAHPMGVESVAWVTERKNVQSMLFALASALAFLAHLDAPRERRAGTWIASFALFACALLSKTTAIFVPPCLVMAAIWQERKIDRGFIARVAPFFALGIALGLHTAHVEKTQVGASGAEFDLTLVERLQLASSIAMFYLRKFLLPLEQIFIYPREEPDVSRLVKWVPAAMVAVIAWTCVSWWRKGSRGPLLIALWVGAGLFPALGFFDVWPFRFSFVADHFAYAAMPALALILTACVGELMKMLRIASRLTRAGVMTAVCVALVPLSVRATLKYESEETLWTATADRNFTAWIAQTNLATIDLRRAELALANGDEEEAKRQARVALLRSVTSKAFKPDAFASSVNISEAQRILGANDRALVSIDEAIALAPLASDLHWMRARLLDGSGDAAGAREALRRAIELADGPDEEIAARRDLFRVLAALGDNAAALAEARRIAELVPDDPDARANLGSLLVANGEGRAGRAELLRALAGEDARGANARPQFWVTTAVRFLKSATDGVLANDEGAAARSVAEALLARSGGDPFARFLRDAVRLSLGESEARAELERLEREARAGGGAQLADEIARFLATRPAG
jgi:tetratricopeptide (TPR) repeat protein